MKKSTNMSSSSKAGNSTNSEINKGNNQIETHVPVLPGWPASTGLSLEHQEDKFAIQDEYETGGGPEKVEILQSMVDIYKEIGEICNSWQTDFDFLFDIGIPRMLTLKEEYINLRYRL